MNTPFIAALSSPESAIVLLLFLTVAAAVIALVWLIISTVFSNRGAANLKWLAIIIPGLLCMLVFPPLGIFAVFALGTAFWIWMLVDCAKRISAQEKDMVIWLIVLVLTHIIGTLVYFFVVYRSHPPPLAAGMGAPPAPPPTAPPVPGTPPGPAATDKTPATCPKCGAPMAADAPEGLCPRCLVQMNLAATAQYAAGAFVSSTVPNEPLPSPDTIAPNFPQLEILECLGRGGMGVVYKARQPRLNRLVALKILAPGRDKDPQFAERFLREAQALARLNHQNIVTVYDFGESGGMYFLLMEYVDGANLRQLLHGGKLDPAQALSIVPRICEALQYAHEQGIVHRDIKPENVLVDKQGRVKIADFGIARMLGQETAMGGYTKGQSVVGTPYYMAPEQVEKPLSVDHRADIYSLGVVFYEMLTGELPMGRFALPSEKVQVDVRLDEVVMRALEKEPQRRYQHASQVKTDVENITGTGTTAAPFTGVKPPVTAAPFAALREKIDDKFVAGRTTDGMPAVRTPWGVGKTIAIIVGVMLALFFIFLVVILLIWSANARPQSVAPVVMYSTPQPPAYSSGVFPNGVRATAPTSPELPQSMPGPDSAQFAVNEAARNEAVAKQRVLETQLQQAQGNLTRLQQLVESGLASTADLNAVKEEVDVLKAEQTGDPVQVAQVRSDWAQKQAKDAQTRYEAGLIPDSDYQQAKDDVDLRAAELTAAQTKAAAAREMPKAALAVAINNGTSSPVSAGKPPADDFGTRLRAAKMMSSWSARDTALASLARDAASADETDTVIAALSAISGWQEKDAAARDAARTIARRGHRADAIRAANLISSEQTRDATLAEIAR